MDESKVMEHISEMYLQYEHLKKEIRRNREEIYKQMSEENNKLRAQNKLLKEAAESYKNMKDLVKYANQFIVAVSQIDRFKKLLKKGEEED